MWKKYRVCGKTVHLNVGLIKEGLLFACGCLAAGLCIASFAVLLWMLKIVGVLF